MRSPNIALYPQREKTKLKWEGEERREEGEEGRREREEGTEKGGGVQPFLFLLRWEGLVTSGHWAVSST